MLGVAGATAADGGSAIAGVVETATASKAAARKNESDRIPRWNAQGRWRDGGCRGLRGLGSRAVRAGRRGVRFGRVRGGGRGFVVLIVCRASCVFRWTEHGIWDIE